MVFYGFRVPAGNGVLVSLEPFAIVVVINVGVDGWTMWVRFPLAGLGLFSG